MKSVAAAAGVSKMTVSNAYNRPEVVAPETHERILRFATALGYSGPHPAGRSLRSGYSNAVGVVLSEDLGATFSDPGGLLLLRGVAAELAAAGQAMVLIPLEENGSGTLVSTTVLDALILNFVPAGHPVVKAAQERHIPLVTVGSPRLPKVPFVGVDDRQAASLAGAHLAELGHSRIGIVSLPLDRSLEHVPQRRYAKSRVDGFLRGIKQAGDSQQTVTIVEATSNDSRAGESAARVLLSVDEDIRPTAIFAITDVLAISVLSAARSMRLDVPEQLSVVGFDDIDEAASTSPGLTTVSYQLYEQGQMAARVVLSASKGRRPPRRQIEPRLVQRASTSRAT